MRMLAAISLLAFAAGCSLVQGVDTGTQISVCGSDSDCSGGQVCFQDGCGDPERDLAVEVLPDARAGMNAQDFPVDDLRGVQDLQLFPPAGAFGQLSVGDQPYSGKVSIRLVGESEVIPGRERVYNAALTLDQGAYAVPAGTGVYSIQFQAADTSVPPLTVPNVRIEAGKSAEVKAAFPASATLLPLSGILVRSVKDPSPLGAIVDVQAVDLETQKQLSQRVPIASDTGVFTLSVSPEAAQKELIGILAQPRPTATGPAMVPSRLFTVNPREPLPVLELGDFGLPVTVSGRVVGSDGKPIEAAIVYLDGKVQGGGTFTSTSVKTDANGAFDGLRTLASDPSGELALWVVPPPTSLSGQLRTAVTVGSAGGFLREFRCPDRVPVQGQVRRPDGRDFPGVRVVARAVAALDGGLTPPSMRQEVYTNDNSTFTLHLDPAVWRLDFISPEPQLPLASRQVTVRAELSSTGGNQTVSLPAFNLSRGRTVTGRVSSLMSPDSSVLVPTPYASVRFYRVVTVEGKKTAELLGEGVTDDQAGYSVVLPTR